MDTRKLVIKVSALLVVGGLSLLVAIVFMRMVGPAEANEVERACGALQGATKSKTIKTIPTQAPDFTVLDHNNKPLKLSSFRGQVVMVNFWASWCQTCAAEKPTLERLQREMGDDLVVLAVASDAEWDPIAKLFPKGSPLKIVLDKPTDDGTYGPVANAWGIQAVPESFIIDRTGMIRHYFINKRDWDSSIARTCLQAIIDE